MPIDDLFDVLLPSGRMQSLFLRPIYWFTKELAVRFNAAFAAPLCNVEQINLGNCNDSDFHLVSRALAGHRQCTWLALGGSITLRSVNYFLRQCQSFGRDNFRAFHLTFIDEERQDSIAEICDFVTRNTRLEALNIHQCARRRAPLTLGIDNGALFLSTIANNTSLTMLRCYGLHDGRNDFSMRLASAIGCNLKSLNIGVDTTDEPARLQIAQTLSKRWNLHKFTMRTEYLEGKSPEYCLQQNAKMRTYLCRNVSLRRIGLFPTENATFHTHSKRFCWQNVHALLLDVYIAILPLSLPAYVVLEIVNRMVEGIEFVSDLKKVVLYSAIKRSVCSLRAGCVRQKKK
jgi:hypothetical protein